MIPVLFLPARGDHAGNRHARGSGPGGGRLEAGRLLVLVLVAPDLLAREAKLAGDRQLGDFLLTRFVDSAAKGKARIRDLLARGQVRIAGVGYSGHRVSHLRIVTCVWPLPSMRHIRRQRNLLPCLVTSCVAT